MRRIVPAILATGLLWSAASNAHTHLVASTPADHAELATAPKEAILTFAEAVVLTAAKLESTAGKTDLKPLPDGSVKEAHIPLPPLGAGRYRLQWRAASDDGHVMSGELSFVVKGPATQ
jgi:methionine-rich copper-binding protein CopC